MASDLLIEARLRDARIALRAIQCLRILAIVTAGITIWISTVYGFHWTDVLPMAAAIVLLAVTESIRPRYTAEYHHWLAASAPTVRNTK